MGSPAPVADILPYVWGDEQVKFWELPEKQKVAFVRRFIAEWQELFQYFPAFRPARELLKRERWSSTKYAEIRSSIPRPEGAEGFNWETLCTKLLQISFSETEGTKRARAKHLLLTRGGQLLVWDVDYYRYKLDRRSSEYRAYSPQLSICGDRQLGAYLRSRSLNWQLFDKLIRMADEAITQRELLLTAMRERVETGRAVLNRIDLSDE